MKLNHKTYSIRKKYNQKLFKYIIWLTLLPRMTITPLIRWLVITISLGKEKKINYKKWKRWKGEERKKNIGKENLRLQERERQNEKTRKKCRRKKKKLIENDKIMKTVCARHIFRNDWARIPKFPRVFHLS